MRKSKADTAETRRRIITIASNLLPRLGLAGSGVEAIMAAAGMTLGGFYRHFESKDQLVAEASAAAFAELRACLGVAASGLSPRDALDATVGYYLSQVTSEDVTGLCPLANLTSELRFAGEQIKAVAWEGYLGMVTLFATYLEQMDLEDPIGLAEAIVTTIVGAVSLSQVVTQPSASAAILENARNTVRILIGMPAAAPT